MHDDNSPASPDQETSSIFQTDLWQTANSACESASDEVGQLTGAIYGYGAETVTGSPVAGHAVGEIVGNFVETNWPNVCDLPENIADSISPASEPVQGD